MSQKPPWWGNTEKKDGETLDYRIHTCLKFKDFLTGSGAGNWELALLTSKSR